MRARKMSVVSKMRDYPEHWIPGQLLDLKRFSDGSFRATLLGEEFKPELANAVEFASGYDAQQFVSHWYQRELQRDPVWRPNHMAEVFAPMAPSEHVQVLEVSNAASVHRVEEI